jgi:hypothetical protein
MRRAVRSSLVGVFLGLAAASPFAQGPSPEGERPWYQTITYNALAEASYTYNFNRPDSGFNQYRAFDYNDHQLELDQVQLVVQRAVEKPGAVGFRLDMAAGTTVPKVIAAYGLFRNTDTGESQDFDIPQAYLTFIAPVGRGLRLDFGKFISYFSFEVIDSYAAYNDNASRSFIFTLGTPATHTGLRATYPFSDKIAGVLVLANGCDVAVDNNRAKTVGLQLVFTPTPDWSLCVNWMAGAEQPHNNHDKRFLYEFNGSCKATERLTVGFDALYGTEQEAAGPGENGTWDGLAGYLRFQVTDRFALSFRGEFFDDRDGVRSGVAQTLKEITVTPEYKIGRGFVVRGDLRCDWSDQDVFQKRALWVRSQPTVSVQILYVF